MYWNIGDTSFRRKKIIEEYTELTTLLIKINSVDNFKWDKKSQVNYYESLPVELKKEKIGAKKLNFEEKAKRARTYTNAIQKLGFCDKKRIVTPIGKLIVDTLENDKFIERDEFEKMLDISDVSLIILRQLQKYTHDGFPTFYYTQKLLLDNNIPSDKVHLLVLMTNKRKYEILEEYFSGNSKLSYLELIDSLTSNLKTSQYAFLTSKNINDDLIFEAFPNRKSKEITKKYIIPLVYLIEKFVTFKDEDSFENLKKFIAGNDKYKLELEMNIKKVKFNDFEYVSNPLFSEDLYTRRFNLLFIIKNATIIQNAKDYSDILRRVANLTGVISSKNGLAIKNDVFKKFIEISNERINCDVYNIKNFDDIFGINVYDKIHSELGINLSKLKENYREIENVEFLEFIKSNFPIEKTIEILSLFGNHKENESKIAKLTTPNAKIPTIYEYMLGISWYHISDYKFNLYDALNLSLDADHLPISHAPGGAGDIEIKYKKNDMYDEHKLLIEATLLRGQSQDRNEYEPVMRHAANLIATSECEVRTLFIAEEVSNNMRGLSKRGFIYTTNSSEDIEGTLECLETKSLINMLNDGVKYDTIYSYIRDNKLNTIYK